MIAPGDGRGFLDNRVDALIEPVVEPARDGDAEEDGDDAGGNDGRRAEQEDEAPRQARIAYCPPFPLDAAIAVDDDPGEDGDQHGIDAQQPSDPPAERVDRADAGDCGEGRENGDQRGNEEQALEQGEAGTGRRGVQWSTHRTFLCPSTEIVTLLQQ